MFIKRFFIKQNARVPKHNLTAQVSSFINNSFDEKHENTVSLLASIRVVFTMFALFRFECNIDTCGGNVEM